MISQHAQNLAARIKEERIRIAPFWSAYHAGRRARRPLAELDALADQLERSNAVVHDLTRELAIQSRRDEINSVTFDKFQNERSRQPTAGAK